MEDFIKEKTKDLKGTAKLTMDNLIRECWNEAYQRGWTDGYHDHETDVAENTF